MECPICFNIIENSAIGSCTHHFCLSCIIKWCEMGGTECPKCKMHISQLRLDREFDQLNNPTSNSSIPIISNQICINNSNISITLRNNYNWRGIGSRGPGVVITKLVEKHKSGLKVGDIIILINNIPCIDHVQSIDIINRCIFTNSTITCKLL